MKSLIADVVTVDPADNLLSLSEIDTRKLRENTVVYVKGEKFPGDGGGGHYVWRGSTWEKYLLGDYLWMSRPQELTPAHKEQLAQNWPEAINTPQPINVLVIGQSNIANGRPGGTIVFNPEVKIWTVAENPNATVDEFQSWDLSLDPPQHSYPAQSGISPAPIPEPDYQKWSYVFANKLQRLTRRPIHIVQAAESGRSIDPWLTVENGGTAGWWDWIVQESADAGITKYDFLFFDHGESGVVAAITYEEAMRRLRQQLEDAGFIDDSTVFLSREVTSGLVNSQAAALVFIDERNGNGNMIDRDLLTIYPDGGLHVDGESHELVGQYHFDWLLARAQTNEVLNFGTATPSAQIQGQIIVLTNDGFKKIPAIEFTANPFPATPDLVFYGEDYVATSGELAGGILTLASGATEPTVNVEQAALTFPAADSQFETAAALLSNTGDWLVGFRMRITESGIARRDIFQQYTPADGERMTFRLVSGIFTFYGNGSGGSLTLPSTELISVNQWVTVLLEKSGDNVNLTVNDTTDTDSVTGLAIQQRAFEISVTGNPLRGDLRKFIVYDRAVTATEKAAVKTWLDSL